MTSKEGQKGAAQTDRIMANHKSRTRNDRQTATAVPMECWKCKVFVF